MKACVIQPPYSRDLTRSDELFAWKLQQLDLCDETMDLIVLPEYSDVPCATSTREETLLYHEKYFDKLMEKCAQTAVRCHALVFVNALSQVGDNYRNTTFTLDRTGRIIGKYDKKHLPPLEMQLGLDSAYTYEPSAPYVVDVDGVRYGFLTCYDFYFYEAFAAIARANVDVIIGCSLQRSDSHDAIETMCRFAAYNTNAYVVRSSVSFDEASTICGASMVVSPEGKVLANLGGKFGMTCAEFDPHAKHLKPAGYGNPPAAHHEYIEIGRKPWQYRPAGPAMIPNDEELPYPRVCAHRGFSTVAPENSMPAFGAAVALGAEEIEFDLWYTADDEIVSIHDPVLDRVSNGTGKVYEHTFAQLKELDFGVEFGDRFPQLPIVTFEEILQKFARQVIMNVHIKTIDDDVEYAEKHLRKIIDLIDRYDCRKHVYFMTGNDNLLRLCKRLAPDIARCCGEHERVIRREEPPCIVDRAIAHGCQKVQLFKPFFTKEDIDKAHANGVRCNVFFADDPEEARRYLEMGVDCILSNDYLRVSNVIPRK